MACIPALCQCPGGYCFFSVIKMGSFFSPVHSFTEVSCALYRVGYNIGLWTCTLSVLGVVLWVCQTLDRMREDISLFVFNSCSPLPEDVLGPRGIKDIKKSQWIIPGSYRMREGMEPYSNMAIQVHLALPPHLLLWVCLGLIRVWRKERSVANERGRNTPRVRASLLLPLPPL